MVKVRQSNYLPPCFKTAIVTLFAFTVFLVNGIVWGQEPWHWDDLGIHVRYTLPGATEGTNNIILIPNVKIYDGSVSTGTWNNVVTSKGTRLSNCETGGLYYPATHMVYYSAVGTTVPYTFNVSPAVEEFWEYHLYGSGYTKVNGISLAQNCHGHSTGKGVWLDDFEKLMKDDYKSYDYS